MTPLQQKQPEDKFDILIGHCLRTYGCNFPSSHLKLVDLRNVLEIYSPAIFFSDERQLLSHLQIVESQHSHLKKIQWFMDRFNAFSTWFDGHHITLTVHENQKPAISIQEVALDFLELLVDNILRSGRPHDMQFARSFRHYQFFKQDFFGDRYHPTHALHVTQRGIATRLFAYYEEYHHLRRLPDVKPSDSGAYESELNKLCDHKTLTAPLNVRIQLIQGMRTHCNKLRDVGKNYPQLYIPINEDLYHMMDEYAVHIVLDLAKKGFPAIIEHKAPRLNEGKGHLNFGGVNFEELTVPNHDHRDCDQCQF